MDKIKLGNTDYRISNMGLGTMYFGSKVDEKVSFSLLDFYVEHGGTFLDSANKYASWIPGYDGGESEAIIGKWMQMRQNRHDLFLSSKVGFAYGDVPRSLKKEIIVSECEKSLKRLKTDCIDLYFAHADDMETPLEDVMSTFQTLKQQGKIRFAGASNFNSWRLAEANSKAKQQGWEGFCCLQQRHTLLEPSLRANFGTQQVLTPEMEQYCGINNVTMMAYSPLLGGAYLNGFQQLPIHYQNKSSESKLLVLNQIANYQNVSVNAILLAWMIQSKPGIIPMVTGSTVLQLSENFKALGITLSVEQMEMLNKDVAVPNKY
ncbi:MAG: aldo/keto reductase [Paludibacter sp.]|nr:aldo/keto reductase [Paludibacter sp.]